MVGVCSNYQLNTTGVRSYFDSRSAQETPATAIVI